MIELWCGLTYQLTQHPAIAHFLTDHGQKVVPFVLVSLGVFILVESGSYQIFSSDGVYLPAGSTIAGLSDAPELTEPLVAKVLSGTKLVARTNAINTVKFNLNPAKVLKAGEGTLAVPNLTQAAIEATAPNAPIEV